MNKKIKIQSINHMEIHMSLNRPSKIIQVLVKNHYQLLNILYYINKQVDNKKKFKI